jgi:cytochrome c-550 PedF
MYKNRVWVLSAFIAVCAVLGARVVYGHGDVAPQPVDTTGLPPLGDEWLTENPYRGNPVAIEIGAHGYTQNCARCHGIEAVSGGLAPDLRELEITPDGDEWYIELTRKGVTQNGVTKMPAFEGILNQEAMWAIRSWVDTQSIAQ